MNAEASKAVAAEMRTINSRAHSALLTIRWQVAQGLVTRADAEAADRAAVAAINATAAWADPHRDGACSVCRRAIRRDRMWRHVEDGSYQCGAPPAFIEKARVS